MQKKLAQHSSIFLALGSLLFSLPSPLLAQIERDNTLGGESSQVIPLTPEADAITGGATRGSNLFHSFRTFNIDEGRAAYFVPDTDAIRTIFSRVTGGDPSQILGTLGVVGNANLFFINPAGILFGPNAKLDLRGSFIATTANSITFPDGQFFNATNPNAPPLLTIDVPVPIGLRFEGDAPREIFNTGNLTAGENIALVGGAIGNIGQISAPGKDIILSTVPAGVDSVVNFDETGKFIGRTQGTEQPNLETADIFLVGGKLDASSTSIAGNVILDSAGDIAFSDGALVDVRGAGEGSITINAQNLEMSGGSQLLAGIGAELGSTGSQAGNLEINVAEGIKLQGDTDAAIDISNLVNDGSIGNAGEIIITTGTLEGSGRYFIRSTTAGVGNAGNVNITAQDAISLDGGGSNSGILSAVAPSAMGNGGDLLINARSLSLSNGSQLATSTFGGGNAGNIQINASDSISINSGAALQALSIGTGNAGNISLEAEGGNVSFDGSATAASTSIIALPGSAQIGQGGNFSVKAGTFSVTNGARLLTGTAGQTETSGSLNAGNIQINASDSVSLSDGSELITETLGQGNGGDIEILARSLSLANGSRLNASTRGQGEGGDIVLNIDNTVNLDRNSAIASAVVAEGHGGNVDIQADSLSLSNGALILTTTAGEGEGGNLTVNASESVQLIGTSAIGFPSSLFTGTIGEGEAGDLSITTGQLLVQEGARIGTDTEGIADGGNLNINAAESVRLVGTFSNSGGLALGGLSSQTSGSGNAGDLNIRTEQLLIQDGAVISTATTGEGKAGNLIIDASESVQLSDISPDGLSASRLTSISQGKDKAGDILINTGRLLIQNGAGITTTTQGSGDGGTLTVNAAESIQLIGTSVGTPNILLTGSTGKGDAGDLIIRTGQLLVRDGSTIATTTTGEGKGGNLTVNASESVQIIGTSADGFIPSNLNAIASGKGQAGDLIIDTRQLLVGDGAFISTGTDGEGNGGKISIKAETLSLIDGALLFASTSGEGEAGDINIDVDKEIIISGLSPKPVGDFAFLPGAIFSAVERDARGNGGDIAITAESLSMSDLGILTTNTYGQGNAGNISIAVDNFVKLNNASFIASNVESGGVGNGGDIDIQARSLTLTDGSEIQAGLRAADGNSPGGIGTGGEIRINASDFVDISGFNLTEFPIVDPSDPTSIAAPRGISSGIFGSTQQGANGLAGNITITTGAFRLSDGAVVEAQTVNSGNAGSITINANTLEVTGGGQVITATRSSGKAGSIILNVADNVILSGNDPNFNQRLALLEGNPAQFTNISSSSGLFANTTEGSIGQGGSIFIDPRIVTIANGATVSVNSQGSGVGGQIDIEAVSLTLNRGTISAETDSTTGGNIALNVQGLLLLRNGSQISTTAGTGQAGGDGGNIFINARAIVANSFENSDITANAFLGRGGNILINTEAIFGIDFRQRLTPLSDITASSEAGLAGTVEINTSGIDPTRGLEALTEERINAEVAQGCQAGARGGGTLSFFNLGRGGTPPSPDDLFNSPMTGEWLSLELEENQKTEPESRLESSSQPMSSNAVWLTCPGKIRK